MLRGGFRGEVLAVASDGTTVPGVTNAPSLSEVPGQFDLVVASIDPQDLGSVVIDSAHKGAHGLVVLTGSEFSAQENHVLVQLARAYGVRALGPDALGVLSHYKGVIWYTGDDVVTREADGRAGRDEGAQGADGLAGGIGHDTSVLRLRRWRACPTRPRSRSG